MATFKLFLDFESRLIIKLHLSEEKTGLYRHSSQMLHQNQWLVLIINAVLLVLSPEY